MGKAQNKNILKKEDITRKNIIRSKGDIQVNFIVRVDIKQELKDLKDCLESTIIEINENLNKLK